MSTITDAIKASNEIHFLVDLKFNGLRKRYSDRQLNIPRSSSSSPAYSFDGKMTSMGSITNRFDINNFKYTMQGVTISIVNPFDNTEDRLQDYEILRKLDGSIGNVYIWSPGLTWEDIETNGLLFSGIFQKQYHDSSQYVFSLSDYSESRFFKIPNRFINNETFPNFNQTASSGSGGKEQQIIFGDWPKGVKLECIDTVNFRYFISSGFVSRDPTKNYVYAPTGVTLTFSALGGTIYNGTDGLGDIYTYVDFVTSKTSYEPISCHMEGIFWSGVTNSEIIEHPADIAEYIIDNYSDLKSGEIDYGSIDSVKNVVPGMKYTTCFNSTISSADAVDRILCKLLAARINKIGGKIGVMCLDLEKPVIAWYTKEEHCISKDISIRKTPFTLICNNLTVNYGVNVATGNYEKSIHANGTNNPTCKQSELDYGKQHEVVLTIPDIWDDGSIAMLVDRYLSFYAYRHDILEWEVSYQDGFDIVEGDVVKVTVPEGSSINGLGWVEESCILLQRELKRNSIKQQLWCISAHPGIY